MFYNFNIKLPCIPT